VPIAHPLHDGGPRSVAGVTIQVSPTRDDVEIDLQRGSHVDSLVDGTGGVVIRDDKLSPSSGPPNPCGVQRNGTEPMHVRVMPPRPGRRHKKHPVKPKTAVVRQPSRVMQPQGRPTGMREHHALTVPRRCLQLVPQLPKPDVQLRLIRIGKLRHIDIAPSAVKLMSKPALPVRRCGTHVTVK